VAEEAADKQIASKCAIDIEMVKESDEDKRLAQLLQFSNSNCKFVDAIRSIDGRAIDNRQSIIDTSRPSTVHRTNSISFVFLALES
jgi:hypothetical protein